MDLVEITRVNARRAVNLPRQVPDRITLQVTNLCDSRCTMCHIWKIYREDKARFRQELSDAELALVVRRAIDRGVRHIDITGGEPFLKPGVPELLMTILRERGFACVTTNALRHERIAREVARVLAASPTDSTLIVSVSIDGFHETHARIRGIADGFERGMRLLTRMNELKRAHPRLLTNVSFTIMDGNVGEMEALMDHLLRERIIDEPDQFTFRPVQSSPYYHRENTRDLTDVIARAVAHIRQRHHFDRNDRFIRGIGRSLREPERMLLPCQALFVSCWIDPYGGVAPCVTMTDRVVGNLRDSDYDLLPIWNCEAAVQMRASIKRAHCPVCWTDCQAHENMKYSPVGAMLL